MIYKHQDVRRIERAKSRQYWVTTEDSSQYFCTRVERHRSATGDVAQYFVVIGTPSTVFRTHTSGLTGRTWVTNVWREDETQEIKA